MTPILFGALVLAAIAALVFGGRVAPPPPEEPQTQAPRPPPAPPPAPTGSARAEVAGPRPTTLEGCVAARAASEIEAPSVIEKIAEIYARELPKDRALLMVQALAGAADRIQDPPARAAALAGVASALIELGAEADAKATLDRARDAANKAGLSSARGEGLGTLSALAAGYVAMGAPDVATEIAGDAADVAAAAAVAHARRGDRERAVTLQKKVADALAAAPKRLSTRIAMARLHAALGEDAPAAKLGEEAEEAERALIHYRVAEQYIDLDNPKDAAAALDRAHEALVGGAASWQRRAALLVELAKSYREIGKPKDADRMIEEVLTLTKDQEASMYQGPILAQIAADLAQAGEMERAEKVIEPAASSQLARTIAYPIARIEILSRQSKLDEALTALETDLTSWTSLAYARIAASNAAAKTPDEAFTEKLRTSACAF